MQHDAVGQPGQRVVQGQMADSRFRDPAVGHIGEGQDAAAREQRMLHGFDDAAFPEQLPRALAVGFALRKQVEQTAGASTRPAAAVHRVRRQSQQIDRAAIDHLDMGVRVHHGDPLAHVVQGQQQGLARGRGAHTLLDPEAAKHDRNQARGGTDGE